MERLTDMPNIGAVLAEKLCLAGIETPADLERLGSVEALRRVQQASSEDLPCRSMLCALEGAIRGVRWHGIPLVERDELWRRYRSQSNQ